jgi:plastocyanin
MQTLRSKIPPRVAALCRAAAILLLTAQGLCAQRVLAAALNATVEDRSGAPIEDAVVTATPLTATSAAAAAEAEGVVDQVHKQFVPYVTVVHVGTRVRFPNGDNIRHHVYSFSPAKRFELPLYSGKAAAPVLFDKPGIVVMGCNIHDWMVGYVYVADTPYFGKTERNGSVQLHDLPAGDYRVQIWHPEMDSPEQATARTEHLDEQATVSANWKIDLPAALHPRRAPVPETSGY